MFFLAENFNRCPSAFSFKVHHVFIIILKVKSIVIRVTFVDIDFLTKNINYLYRNSKFELII